MAQVNNNHDCRIHIKCVFDKNHALGWETYQMWSNVIGNQFIYLFLNLYTKYQVIRLFITEVIER